MNRRRRRDTVVPKRLEALVRDLPSVTQGDEAALHRTRVASRRVRAALPMLADALSPRVVKKARQKTRALTRALGTVRELDVALSLLATRPAPTPERRMAVERVRAQILHERDVRREGMLREIAALDPDRLARKIAGQIEEGTVGGVGLSWRPVLARQLDRRARALLAAVEDAGALYLSDRLHVVRVAIKKLRYALEIAGEYRAGPTAAPVRVLKRVQEMLGALHDLEVVIRLIHHAQLGVGPSEPVPAAEFEALVHDAEQDCRRLHARYLAARARVTATAHAAIALGERVRVLPVQRSFRRGADDLASASLGGARSGR